MTQQESDPTDRQIELPDWVSPLWLLYTAWIMVTLIQAFREESQKLLEEQRQMETLLSIDEVADILGVSKRTVEDIVASERLKPIWVKGQRRFHPDAIDAYMRRQSRKDK